MASYDAVEAKKFAKMCRDAGLNARAINPKHSFAYTMVYLEEGESKDVLKQVKREWEDETGYFANYVITRK